MPCGRASERHALRPVFSKSVTQGCGNGMGWEVGELWSYYFRSSEVPTVHVAGRVVPTGRVDARVHPKSLHRKRRSTRPLRRSVVSGYSFVQRCELSIRIGRSAFPSAAQVGTGAGRFTSGGLGGLVTSSGPERRRLMPGRRASMKP